MASVKGRGNTPERIVRAYLHQNGMRFAHNPSRLVNPRNPNPIVDLQARPGLAQCGRRFRLARHRLHFLAILLALAVGLVLRQERLFPGFLRLGPLHVSQRANAVMQAQDGGGAIVNIGSVSAIRPSPGTAAYGAAKAGLLNLTTTLAVEFAPKVRVNAITAGLMHTELSAMHYGDETGEAAVAATIPAGRMGVAGDLAGACLYLASPLASYVSGANLLVHGGGEKPAYLDAAKS